MKKITGLLFAIALLGYGLLRMAVGAALLAFSLDWIYFSDLEEAAIRVSEFFLAREDRQLIHISIEGYFGYIMLMGVTLTIGAIGVLKRNKWGFAVLLGYLALHGALFVNYLEVNPKLFGLALQAGMLAVIFHIYPPTQTRKKIEADTSL